MSTTLTIGYSPCPNDTFIFYALVHGKVRVPDIVFRERLEDVETLNLMALNGALDITKISFHALGHVRQQYALLRSGSALGRGCGPLIVAKPGKNIADLKRGAIAIPGKLTTATLLLRLFDSSIENVIVMTFDRIMEAVSREEVTAGIIIHESRFTYPLYNLEKMLDLGEWWEQFSGLPVPLGGILGKRSLGRDVLLRVESGIRESLLYARTHPQEVLEYCERYSQEMNHSVMNNHIELYVNDFSIDLGYEGFAAVCRLFHEAEIRGIFPHCHEPFFAEENQS